MQLNPWWHFLDPNRTGFIVLSPYGQPICEMFWDCSPACFNNCADRSLDLNKEGLDSN